MVPARTLQRLRDSHGTTPFAAAAAAAAGVDAVTAPTSHHHMAQEPIINQEQPKPPPPPPPPPQENQGPAPQEEEERRGEALVLPPLRHQQQQQQQLQPAGTSGSSSGGSSSNGGGGGGGHGRDWLRLGLGPASPGAASDADVFAAQPRAQEMLPGMGMPPDMPGIPQASIQMPVPRAGPPWLPPWSPAPLAAHQPGPFLLPFAHRPFCAPGSPAASASGLDTIRVVLPPPAATATAGVWFVLHAAPHQGREPFLPQIPRSYLRIKDGRVTVRLLIKYLVSKFGLENESEVEITCRGRPLLPFMTLQHVRDSIWCQRDAVSPSVAPDMSTANHIMVLQYGRIP